MSKEIWSLLEDSRPQKRTNRLTGCSATRIPLQVTEIVLLSGNGLLITESPLHQYTGGVPACGFSFAAKAERQIAAGFSR